jgi:leucyl-tRNA---protein transferase
MYASCPYPALPPPVDVALTVLPAHECPYLPERQATLRAFGIRRMPGEVYHQFLDAGFRRTGHVVYQPVCRGCRACVPIRVPVAEFSPNKSLRRCRRRNGDVRVEIAAASMSDEKLDLYRRYRAGRHEGTGDDTADSLRDFLYCSPADAIEFTYRDGAGKLLGVGICDVCALSLSSVYYFFDPGESRRGLGNFGALVEIDYARTKEIPHWYLGYWVKGCRAMEYKANFRPHELLHPDGVWRRGD